MSLVPVFNGSPILQVLLAIAMVWWGYKKGASPALIAQFRPAPTDGVPVRGWVNGKGAFSSSGSSSGSSGGSSSGGFGGGSSGGGGASGSW